MRKGKKALSLLICLVLLVGLFPAAALAEGTEAVPAAELIPAEAAGLAVGLALLCLGAWLAARGYGAALLTASVWLLFCQESARGLVKRRQIV